MEKKKKCGAGFVIALLAIVTNLFKGVKNSGLEISLLYLLTLAALLFGAYWLFTRLKSAGKPKSRLCGMPPAAKKPAAFPLGESSFKTHFKPTTMQEDGAEQWKSLYQAGLITKEEYRERLNRFSGQG